MSDFDDEKRKRRDEDSEEDLSFSDVDEDEEDEESEERQAPKRKKRKTEGRSDLVLLEAEEDDDEEDEDEIDGDEAFEAGEDIGGGSDTEENRQKARELFKNLSKDVDETEMKAMADRYRQSSRMVEDFDEFPVDANDALAIRQSLLPTTADPTMWCIRCQEGKERDVVRDLLAKFLIAEAGPVEDRLHIFSVHCVDGDKGRFYVESRKESHVRTALAQIPFVRLTSPFKLLKRMEMPRVLVVPEKAQLQEGQWVRVKNGIYRDDLAQVYIVSDNGDGKVTVRIVPRISKEQYTGEGGAKRARAESRAMRPAARPFRPEEVSDKSTIEMVGERTRVTNVGEDDEDKENQDGEGASDEVRWNGMWFKSGLLVKEFRLSGLHTSNIHPTQEEVGRFKRAVASWQKSHGGVSSSGGPSSQIVGGSQSLGGGDPLDDFSVDGSSVTASGGGGGSGNAVGSSSAKSKAIVFAKGDHIQVTRGEYVSVTGIVTFATSANVEFRPDDVSTFGKKLITVPTVQVRKYFGPGLHVKILSGVYSGETGTITAVHDDTVTIYSDVVHKEIRANMADLQIAFSTGSGNTSLGSYHLFDLVQLGDSVGVIVDVERDGFQILGENGQTRYVPLAEVGARRNVAKASIGDAHNNYVNLGETVRILEGPYKDLTGILKHISRATVFIQCQNALVRDNRGLVCLRKHHIASVIDRSSSQLNSASGPNGMNNASGRVIHGMGGGGGAGPGAGARRIDPNLMRKEVIVKKGQWKGYRGMIKNASEREYTILLSTGSRTVKVPKEDVGAADGSAGHNNHAHNNHSQNNDRFNDYNGSQTPMRHMTPRHPSSGGGGYDAWSSDSSRNGRSSNAMDEFDPNYRPSNINSASSNAMDISNGSTMSGLSSTSTIVSGGHHHMPSGVSQGSSTTLSSSSSSSSTASTSTSSFLTPQIPQTPGFGLSSGGSLGSDYSRLSSVTTPGGVPYTPYAGSMMPPVTPGAGLGMAPPMTPGGAMMMPPMTPGGAPSMPSSSSYPIPQTPGAPSTTITASSSSSSGGFAYPSTPGGASLVPPSTPGGAMLGSSVLSGLGSLVGSQGSSALLGSQGSSTSSSLTSGGAGLLPGGITASSLSSLSALTSNIPYTPGGVMIPSTPGAVLGPSSSMIPPMTPGGAISGIIPSTPMDISSSSSSSSSALLGSSSSIPTSSSAAAAAAATTMDPDAWCQAGFEVFDATSSETPPPRFVILDPMKGTPLVKVEALRAPEGERTGVVSNITRSSLRLVPPSKKDRVAIITTGKIGILIGIDEQDGGVSGGHGIVKNPDDSEIQVLPMSNFAKVHSL